MDKSVASGKSEKGNDPGKEEEKDDNGEENDKFVEVKLSKNELAMLEPDFIEPRMIAKYELICQVLFFLNLKYFSPTKYRKKLT